MLLDTGTRVTVKLDRIVVQPSTFTTTDALGNNTTVTTSNATTAGSLLNTGATTSSTANYGVARPGSSQLKKVKTKTVSTRSDNCGDLTAWSADLVLEEGEILEDGFYILYVEVEG